MHELKLEFKWSEINLKSSFMAQGERLHKIDLITMIDTNNIDKLLK